MEFVTLNLSEARAAESRRQARAARKAAKAAASGKEIVAVTKQAMGPNLFSLNSGDPEDAKFRRISNNGWLRDLNPAMQERMREVCYFLAVTTPFGKRIVEILTSYAVGEGFKTTATAPEVKAVIDSFWNDSVNNIEEQTKQFSNELAIFGELCLPVTVNPVSGSVRVGYIDPQQIDFIEFGSMIMGTNAAGEATYDMVTVPVRVHLKRRMNEAQPRVLEVIKLDEDPESPTWGQLAGDCFYFAVNRAKGGSRGISELFSLADWIDVFDNMVFDFADKVRFLNAWVYHYTVTGADEATLEKFKKQVTKSPPRQGGVQVTNESVKIEAVTPQLQGADMAASSQIVKLYGMGGAGLPAWFFADPIDANRSTAQEMQGPTGKKLTDWQNNVKRILKALVNFAVAQASYKGTLPPKVDLSWNLDVPDLNITDYGAAATAMQSATNAIAMMEDRGWITSDSAARAGHVMLTQIGVQVGTDEFAKAQQDKADRAARDANDLYPQSKLAAALEAASGKGTIQ